jgi:hypothetical protein
MSLPCLVQHCPVVEISTSDLYCPHHQRRKESEGGLLSPPRETLARLFRRPHRLTRSFGSESLVTGYLCPTRTFYARRAISAAPALARFRFISQTRLDSRSSESCVFRSPARRATLLARLKAPICTE